MELLATSSVVTTLARAIEWAFDRHVTELTRNMFKKQLRCVVKTLFTHEKCDFYFTRTHCVNKVRVVYKLITREICKVGVVYGSKSRDKSHVCNPSAAHSSRDFIHKLESVSVKAIISINIYIKTLYL